MASFIYQHQQKEETEMEMDSLMNGLGGNSQSRHSRHSQHSRHSYHSRHSNHDQQQQMFQQEPSPPTRSMTMKKAPSPRVELVSPITRRGRPQLSSASPNFAPLSRFSSIVSTRSDATEMTSNLDRSVSFRRIASIHEQSSQDYSHAVSRSPAQSYARQQAGIPMTIGAPPFGQESSAADPAVASNQVAASSFQQVLNRRDSLHRYLPQPEIQRADSIHRQVIHVQEPARSVTGLQFIDEYSDSDTTATFANDDSEQMYSPNTISMMSPSDDMEAPTAFNNNNGGAMNGSMAIANSHTASTTDMMVSLTQNDHSMSAVTLHKPNGSSTDAAADDDDQQRRRIYRRRKFVQRLLRHKTLKLCQLAFWIYVVAYTFFGGLYDWNTRTIVDTESLERTQRGVIGVLERPVVAQNTFQLVCLLMSRSSAFLMYPALIMVYFSKLRATALLLSHTPISMFLRGDLHKLHLYCGYSIFVFSTSHTAMHLARWYDQGNLWNLLLHHFTGRTGFTLWFTCLLICVPMMFQCLKRNIPYEIRKSILHYFFLVFAGALCFHVKARGYLPNGGFAPYIMGTLLAWYFLDATYCFFCMTEKIETTKFHVLPTGVQMTMGVSEAFQNKGAQGGYCYVCLPWISRHQWHAFSLFENPLNPMERQIFMQKGGDWTTKVHQTLQRDTVRPVWVQGPFPSPYDSAGDYDNQILVASGIGITPALSVIRAHQNTRRINLVWAVRDPHLLRFFLQHLYLDHRGWNLIFYTGKEELGHDIEIFSNTNVCIIRGRPKLSRVIPNIVYGIESGEGLPERYSPDEKLVTTERLVDMIDTVLETDSKNRSVTSRNTHGNVDTDGDGENDENDDDVSISSRHVETLRDAAALQGFDLQDMDKSNLRNVMKAEDDTTLLRHLGLKFQPWEHQSEARRYVKNLCRKSVLKTWGMLYCGGARVVEQDLKQISDEYGIDLHVESFGW